MGTIYAKGKKLYLGLKTEAGKWRYIASGFSVGEEPLARRMLKKLETDVERGERIQADGGPQTVEKYAERWLEQRRKLGLRNVYGDESRLNLHMLPVLGKLLLAEVRVRHLKDLVMRLRTAGELAPRTVHHVYGLAHKLFHDAVLDELIEFNPCQLDKSYLGKKRDKDPTWRVGAIFTRDELAALISDERIPVDRRMVYALEGLAGLRHGEMAGLRWQHYDSMLEPLGRLLVAFSYEHSTKTERPRLVPVHPMLAAMLASWRAEGWAMMMGREPKPDDLIMPSRRGSMRDKKVAWEGRHRDFEALGLRPRRGHDLRRTFISLARADGARPDILKLITHGPAGDMISIYTEMPWETLCEQVAGLWVGQPRPAAEAQKAAPVVDEDGPALTTGLTTAPVSATRKEGDPTGIRSLISLDSAGAFEDVPRPVSSRRPRGHGSLKPARAKER